jgi:hypothetical protein
MSNNKHSIAVLLPTRGRTRSLADSIASLLSNAKNIKNIQFILGFDNDDKIGFDYFIQEIQPNLDSNNIEYTILGFDPMGYDNLNQYYNSMATEATADWLFVWNDDAIMETQHWDQVIAQYTDQFKVLKVHTHNEHPYSIFPIVPSNWVDLLGQLSIHQMIDAEISQLAYMLDILEIVDIDVVHDRTDLTGNQENSPTTIRTRFEHNPNHPLDFHNPRFIQQRLSNCDTLAAYMKSIGQDITFWENVKATRQDPWEKLKKNDINSHMFQFKLGQL